MGRLAAVKLQQEEERRNPPKPTKPVYPGFAETGIDQKTWESQQPEFDDRSGLSKAWDALNLGDSGRSWSTKTPTKSKSVMDSLGDVGTAIFSGTEKTLDAVQALTGATERKQNARDKKMNADIAAINDKYKDVPDGDPRLKEAEAAKKKIRDKYQEELQSDLEDTKWAGDGYKTVDGKRVKEGTGDRLKKAAGVSAETVSEWIPVGKGAQAGKLAEKAAVKGAKEAAEKGAQEVIEKGATGLSRMAKAKLAAKVGGQQAIVGAVGGVGGAASEDGTNLHEIAQRGLTGLVSGGVLGGASTYLPDIKLPKGEGGFIANPFYRSGKEPFAPLEEKAKGLIDNLESEATKTPVAKNTQRVFQVTEGDKPTDWVFQDADELANFINGRTNDSMAVRFMDVPKHELVPTSKGDGVFQLKSAVDALPPEKRNVVMAAEVEPPTTASLEAKVPRREPTLTEISDTANKRPDAEIQKAIETAHNAGDNAKVEELIPQLSPDMQAGMRSALGLPPETPKVQLKVLDDVQREADLRAPGDANTPHAQAAETKTQKGAQYLVDDIDRLQKETGIDAVPLDRKAAAALTGEVKRSGFQEFRDKMGRNFQDTLTYATRTLGKTGSDFAYDMLQGNKFKRDALDALRDNMTKLSKLNDKLAGKSVTARRDLGARIGSALDDRANADQFLKTPQEKELFDHYVQVFDYIKTLREKSGLETLENYRPWVSMKEASEPPTWLAENVTNKRTQTLSRFSKERVRTEAGEDVDNNLADMIYGYVNSQLNEMAYDAPVKRLKGGIDGLSAGNKANVGAMNEGIDYMRQLVEQAVNPQRKNPLERAANKLTSNVYGSVLPFNIRLAVQNKTQQFAANSRVSKGAVRLAKKISETDAKELEKGLVFGDTTVYGQLEDVNPTLTGKGKGIIEKVKKVDPYQKSEHGNVISSYHKGAMQAVLDSEPYKAARASGMKPQEAVSAALKDPAVKEAAIRRGNVVVNDTQFGASPLARPEMLREEGSIWGVIPKKTIYMFTRFPIGMSQHTLEALDGKSTRALEMLKNGDPRAVSIAEMRTNYKALLSSMKDAKLALKNGTDIGIPKEVLDEQIAAVSKNIGVIDKEAKKLSQVRSGKTIKNLGKMWAAAAAIQIIFDGGIQSFADDPAGTSADALAKTNPTASNKVVGSYSPLAAITSSASPLDKYGNVNERAIANYVPGVGLAVNRARDVKKLFDSFTGSGDGN